MRRLAIYGTGGLAREVLELVRSINAASPTFEMIGWLDDDPLKAGARIKDMPVLGPIEQAYSRMAPFEAVIAIGNTVTRHLIARRVEALGVTSPILIDPRAWLGSDVDVGPGTIVCAGCAVTTDIKLGKHVILNLNVTVGHDAILEDFVTVAPSVNISGNVTVGEGTDVGTGSATVQGVEIGAWSIVGAGAVIARDVPPNVTAVGVPAKVIKERPAGWQEAPSNMVSP